MSSERPDDRTERRADELLPEEVAAGTDDAEAQAAAVLADSDRRQAGRSGDADDPEGDADDVEHRRSETTVEP